MAITTDNTILYSTYVLSKRGHLFVFIVYTYRQCITIVAWKKN